MLIRVQNNNNNIIKNNNSYGGDNNGIIYVQTYVLCTSPCYYYGLKYYFDNVTMVDKNNRSLLSVKPITITHKLALVVTITAIK